MKWLINEWVGPRIGVPSVLTGGWRDSNTIRALTALQLIDNNWIFDTSNKNKAELAIKHMNSDILSGLVK